MKKFYFLAFAVLFLFACVSTADVYQENNNHKYFDENYQPVSRSEFQKKLWVDSLNFTPVMGDSLYHIRLVKQMRGGYIKNKDHLVLTLEKLTGRKINTAKPIVISYFPAKDTCDYYERATRASIIKWHTEYEKELYEIAKVKPIYIYKEDIAVEKYKGILPLYKDPDDFIERLFFKYHSSCGSFAVIAEDGEYFSYLGRYRKEYVWHATRVLSGKEVQELGK